jgi:hypothetical protein
VNATVVIRHLLEEPEDPKLDTNLDLPDLEHYAGPVEFDTNVRDILEYARQLKKQAEEAGALQMFQKSRYSAMDIDRAILTIAVQKYNEEMVAPSLIAKSLRKHMHHVWD